MAKVIDEEIKEEFILKDITSGLITVTSTSIDLTSGVSATTTTTLPPEILSRSAIERGVAITDEIVKKDRALKDIEVELPAEVNRLLQKGQDSVALKRGHNYYYFKCNFYGSSFGGENQSVNMTFVNAWNLMKDSTDIESLKNEIPLLVKELIKHAENESDYEKIANVIQAMDELKKANGPGMLQHLKKAGKWVLDVALETGKDIAAKVISEIITKGM